MLDPFDSVMIVDWSAASTATSKTNRENAIWVGRHSRDARSETHFRTRAEAEDHIRTCIETALRNGKRSLVGFDFAFGYPAGFAARLTGSATAAAVWHWLANQIEDAPDNQNNRFAVAGRINRLFGGMGPFWSHPRGQTHEGLPARKAGIDHARLGVGEFRLVEQVATGAKSVWMLCNPGAVGSQSLVGLPMIHRLSQMDGVSVWPFQPPSTPVVLAEVYPSLLSRAVNHALHSARPTGIGKAAVKDQIQTRLLAQALFALSKGNQLAALLHPPAGRPQNTEEGWILGAGHVAALETALA